MSKGRRNTEAQRRKVISYPKPPTHTLIIALATINEESISATSSHIHEEYFRKMPSQERQRILQQYEEKKKGKNSY